MVHKKKKAAIKEDAAKKEKLQRRRLRRNKRRPTRFLTRSVQRFRRQRRKLTNFLVHRKNSKKFTKRRWQVYKNWLMFITRPAQRKCSLRVWAKDIKLL